MSNKDRLLQLLYERAYREGEFTLSSGQTSTQYFDGKMLQLAPEGSYLIGEVLYEHLKPFGADAIGGLAVGAVPMVTSIVTAAWHQGDPGFEGFFVRNVEKEHGTKKKIEGKLDPGSKVIIVDDVVTSGGSLMKAVDAVREIDCEVVAVSAIVDRLSGATELFEQHGLGYHPVFTSEEVAGYAPA